MATQTITLPDHVDPAIVRHVDLFDRVLRYDNPFETIIPEIHQGPAVFYADNVMFQQPGWVVRRSADLRVIYADKEHFVKRANSGFAALIGEDWNIIPTETDPPLHTGYRAALNPLFSPSRMMSLDNWVRDRSQQLIATFKDKGECEFIKDFAEKFPISIFLDLIGLPQDRPARAARMGASADPRQDRRGTDRGGALRQILHRRAGCRTQEEPRR